MEVENWSAPPSKWWAHALRYTKDKDETRFKIDRAELLDLMVSSFVLAEHGTTSLAARNHGRHAIGIELNAEYIEISARRLRQLSLLWPGERARALQEAQEER